MPHTYISEKKKLSHLKVIPDSFWDNGLNRKLLEPCETIQLLRDTLIENTINKAPQHSWLVKATQSHSQSLRNGSIKLAAGGWDGCWF